MTIRSWTADAACLGHDPDIWFPASGGEGGRNTKLAVAICRTCPVQAECHREWLSLTAMQQRYGIWAGRPPNPVRREYRARQRDAS